MTKNCVVRGSFTAILLALSQFIPISQGDAKQVKLDVALANPTMLVGEDAKKENYLRIGITGFELPSDKQRLPVNVAIVIDKSGSMQGEKIEQARKAAIQAIDRLRDSDIVSVVTYDSSVNVLVPATKASDRETIRKQIASIAAGGNTALFAGVSKAAGEIRKFLDDKHVNRVILLSDGLANVGPASPAELEQLGESLIKEGISVSTMGLGLGYNEDLMTRLALASSGNHVFIEDAENLVQVFQNEFDDVLSVVAQKLNINAKLAEGIRPVKVLNYPANITGQFVSLDLGQLYSRQERYFVLEVEIAPGENGSNRPVASVELEYMNMYTESQDKLTSTVQVKFTDSPELAERDVDKQVAASCVIQIANERNTRATALRDAGKIEEARGLLMDNAAFLNSNYLKFGVSELKLRCEINGDQAANLDSGAWAENRKLMRQQQFQDLNQQRYKGDGTKSDFDKSKP
ncbi:MAG: VWA domain-containing protein [Planctomycetales bacterium]|nr:VWA domain-containing protein [Planctomycetales bacterium]